MPWNWAGRLTSPYMKDTAKMDLIIDANIFMSALVSTGGKTYDLIFNNKIK